MATTLSGELDNDEKEAPEVSTPAAGSEGAKLEDWHVEQESNGDALRPGGVKQVGGEEAKTWSASDDVASADYTTAVVVV